ncbi:hypothetical protein K488DRAFT_78243 [Vararia minispora EC-137]|uniref:Uncharacterized protein n=1 Tax=Vararia minispora EC-137 TaxID=1314806 RepID=A0ACB8QLU8_9AGAM|nr:hypothetical protein K488DRAFT_78243 [Vararia minispora EC-137]
MTSTPSIYSVRHTRALSPPLSSATGSTISPHVSRMNIVTRLAIEGHAKEGDSVPIRMYLKLAVPADNVSPGSTIPLFKEENVKIVDSNVHPLDQASTPYNFSSSQSPLLHNAARALTLPARLSQSYMILFTSQSSTSSRYATAIGSTAPLDRRYTGYITISGFYVSFVLPKELPPRPSMNSMHEDSGEHTPVPSKFRPRRGSVGEKNMLQFMVGISMVVPYLSRPPRAPWLLSIPTPRCLSNNLKLRIFPPQSNNSTSSSYQSLSSTDGESDVPPWDVTADPHVTRQPISRRSAYQYQNFADDEGSDSASPGFSEDVGIQGTFQSTERIRIRWSHPPRSIDDGSTDGRRRVGVEAVQGEMVCEVLGRAHERSSGREGVAMRLEYRGTCKATLLGMDVGLEVKGCDVGWWSVIGGAGYTGHDISGMNRSLASEPHPLFDMPQPNSNPDAGSTSSTASLLRIPLPPSKSVPEYSFESTPTTPGSEAGMSSVFSTTDGDSKGRSRASSVNEPDFSPSTPITLHININDILPPNSESLAFTIAGTVLRSDITGSERVGHPEDLTVSLPRFRVLAADSETIQTTVRSGLESTAGIVSVSASSDIKARPTELRPGGRTKLGSDGGRITLHTPPARRGPSPFPQSTVEDEAVGSTNVGRGISPVPFSRRQRVSSTNGVRDTLLSSLRPIRTGELMIPYVNAIVIPFLGDGKEYAVRLQLPAPANPENEWLEFFLAYTGSLGPPRVEFISATLEGVPVLYEEKAVGQQEKDSPSVAPLGTIGVTGWITSVRVHIGVLAGGSVEVVYTIHCDTMDDAVKGKRKTTDGVEIMLPIFDLPIGRIQVDIESGKPPPITFYK